MNSRFQFCYFYKYHLLIRHPAVAFFVPSASRMCTPCVQVHLCPIEEGKKSMGKKFEGIRTKTENWMLIIASRFRNSINYLCSIKTKKNKQKAFFRCCFGRRSVLLGHGGCGKKSKTRIQCAAGICTVRRTPSSVCGDDDNGACPMLFGRSEWDVCVILHSKYNCSVICTWEG